jgi:hypothetical protein
MDDGLKVVFQKTPGVATGTCAVLINEGERSLVANLAAANTFTAAHLESAEAKEAISKAQILYTAGTLPYIRCKLVLSCPRFKNSFWYSVFILLLYAQVSS